jgi:uncharacterized membrane protein
MAQSSTVHGSPETPTQRRRVERLYLVAITLKGVDGALQLIGGLVLLAIPPAKITGWVHAIVTRDLLGDPGGSLAQHLQQAADHFAGGTRGFAVVYLLAHGVVKLGLFVALLRHIRPMYPVAAVVLLAFVAYEIVRTVHTHSILLPFFALLDLLIVVMILREYRDLRRGEVPGRGGGSGDEGAAVTDGGAGRPPRP